jgi:multidrug efflux pump subunit AcrB
MKLSERSLQNPAAVAAAAAIVVLFGVLALVRLPIQLLPDLAQPTLFVEAQWREAAPAELEEALIEPIEEAMRGLPGMVEMRSESNRGRGGVELRFEVGTDMTRVMLDVVSRLNTLPPLPPDADEPQVFGGENFNAENAASLLVRPIDGHSVADIAVQYQQLMEEVVEPRLARVAGRLARQPRGRAAARSAGRFDPHRLAALGISPQRLAETVIAARDVSAGFAECRPSPVHRTRHGPRTRRRPRQSRRRLERRPAALPARCGRRPHRARQRRVVRLSAAACRRTTSRSDARPIRTPWSSSTASRPRSPNSIPARSRKRSFS